MKILLRHLLIFLLGILIVGPSWALPAVEAASFMASPVVSTAASTSAVDSSIPAVAASTPSISTFAPAITTSTPAVSTFTLTDSTSVTSRKDCSWQDFILSGALVAAGAAGLFEPVSTWKKDVQMQMRNLSKDNRVYFDDYIQYLPVAAAFTLDLVGVDACRSTTDHVLLVATSYGAAVAMGWGVKHLVTSMRPGVYYGSYLPGKMEGISPEETPKFFNSFPSGHSLTAFMGAELVRLEYGEEHPWLAVGAYAVAAGTGFMRVYNNQHWFTDVLAGAGIGILGTRVGLLLLPLEKKVVQRVFKKEITVTPMSDGYHTELAFSLTF